MSNLSKILRALSPTEFDKVYGENPNLKQILYSKPSSNQEFVSKYLASKLWRMNNLYTIIDKAGDRIPFVMNRAQHVVYAASLVHYRLLILKSRQQGISTFWLLNFFDDAIFKSNYNCGLMAQGKEEASTLLDRLSIAWASLDPGIKRFLSRKITKDNSGEMTFNNGSTIFIRTSFRSATLQRLHISELGKIANKYPERARETKTGTLQALAMGNIGVIESTAEGDNMFKQMWDDAKKQATRGKLAGKDFMPVFLSWLDDPDCVEYEEQEMIPEAETYFATLTRELTQEQKNFWIMQYRELGGYIYQEYPATDEEAFRAARDGTYWAKRYTQMVILKKQRRTGLYDSHLPVYIASDIGKNDYTVLVLFQVFDKQIRIIDEYYDNNKWLGHYVTVLKDLAEERGYQYETWFLPHDARVADISQRELKTREEIINEEGFSNTIILDRADLSSSIEHVRSYMHTLYIDERCGYIENCILNYTKEWNEKSQTWSDEPKRSEYRHGADSVRYTFQAAYVYLFDQKDAEDYYNSLKGVAV